MAGVLQMRHTARLNSLQVLPEPLEDFVLLAFRDLVLALAPRQVDDVVVVELLLAQLIAEP